MCEKMVYLALVVALGPGEVIDLRLPVYEHSDSVVRLRSNHVVARCILRPLCVPDRHVRTGVDKVVGVRPRPRHGRQAAEVAHVDGIA